MTPVNIIVLNGSSCSGKTTLARALQEVFREPYLRLGVDIVHAMLPDRFRDWHNPANEQMVKRALTGMHQSAATMADAGNYIILDTVLVNRSAVLECARALTEHRAFFIGLFCDEAELRKRADARGKGLAETALKQAHHIHAHGHYDLKLNTTGKAPGIMAEQIKNMTESRKSPAAFEQLRAQGGDV